MARFRYGFGPFWFVVPVLRFGTVKKIPYICAMLTTILPDSINRKQLGSLPGVRVKGDKVTFNGSWTKEKAEEALNLADKSVKLINEVRFKQFQPTEMDLNIVRGRVAPGEEVDKYGFYECDLSDTKIDFTDERIQKAVLEAMKPQADGGVSVLVNHNPDMIVGSTYRSTVIPIPDDHENYIFRVWFYVPPHKVSTTGGTIKQDIDSRVLQFVSIAFRNDKIKLVEAGNRMILEYEYDEERPPILVEMSLVYRGANPRAALKKLGADRRQYRFTKQKLSMEKKSITLKAATIDGKRKEFDVVAKANDEGDKIVLTVDEGFQSHLDEMNEKALKYDALNTELTEAKEPIVNEITGLQKKLEQFEDEPEDLKKRSLKKLNEQLGKLKGLDGKSNKKKQIDPGNGGDPGNKSEEPVEEYPY